MTKAECSSGYTMLGHLVYIISDTNANICHQLRNIVDVVPHIRAGLQRRVGEKTEQDWRKA